MSDVCTTPAPLPDLLAWWLGEMDEQSQARFEEHLFGCGECSARLGHLVHLGNAIQREFREGRLGSVLSAASVRRLKDAGMRVREYRMQPGGSVNCTVAPEDDLVAAHLHAPLRDVQRLDLSIDAGDGNARRRVADVAFDPASDEVVLASSVAALRKLGVVTQRVDLIAESGGAERVIGSYTFNHSPWRVPETR